MKRGIWATLLAVGLVASATPAGARIAWPGSTVGPVRSAPVSSDEMAPGDKQLVNLAHVFNFTPPASSGVQADGKGTDLEFFTNEVPNRDYTTGQLLDAAGNPLAEGSPPVMVLRDFAIMGSYNGGAWVFDITDPESVKFVKNIPCRQTQNDVQLRQFGSQWVLALTKDGSGNPCANPQKGQAGPAGIAVFDVTDPYEARPLYSFRTTGGAHNFTFHPTKPFGWVSTGDLPGAANHIPIIDFTDLMSPKLAADIEVQGGPHDITFSADGLRAYVASENNYRIYDTTNPGAPTLISVTPNVGTYAHGFDPTPDRKIAVATNESLALGGFFAGGSTVCPGEGLTFFSVEGDREKTPVPLGEFLASVQGRGPDDRACTGHVGKIGNTAMTLGWYIGGVRVVDFSNPSQPKEVGIAVMEGAEVWAAKYHKGPYVYAADMRRGFDVFKWTGSTPAPWLS